MEQDSMATYSFPTQLAAGNPTIGHGHRFPTRSRENLRPAIHSTGSSMSSTGTPNSPLSPPAKFSSGDMSSPLGGAREGLSNISFGSDESRLQTFSPPLSPVKPGSQAFRDVHEQTSSGLLSVPGVVKGQAAPLPPGAGRRGHAHRRSGAISQHDILSIMTQPAVLAGDPASGHRRTDSMIISGSPDMVKDDGIMSKSAPTSPMAMEGGMLTPPLDTDMQPSGAVSPRKSKVAFTDQIEYIPRPPSIDTLSTSATRDNGSSISSMSSVMQNRPSSVGPSLGRSLDVTTAENLILPPPIPSSHTRTSSPRLLSFAFPRPGTPGGSKHKKSLSDSSTTDFKASLPGAGVKKTKGVKSWAGSILLRRKRQIRTLPRRSPTPPLPASRSEIFATYGVPGNSSYVLMPVRSNSETDLTFQDPYDEDASSPIIDLDAALGPFNTPAFRGGRVSPTKSSFGEAKKRMHSGQGYTFHRRAESAPEMQLFEVEEGEYDMGDVFEEEEETEDEDEQHVDTTTSDGQSFGVTVDESDNDSTSSPMDLSEGDGKRGLKRKISEEACKNSTGSSEKRHSGSDWEMRHALPTPGSSPSLSPSASDNDLSNSSHSTQIASAIIDASAASTPTPPLTPNTQNLTDDAATTSSASIYDEQFMLGEPGPEVRMSVDDLPSLTGTGSTHSYFSSHFRHSKSNLSQEVPKSRDGSVKDKDSKKEKRWSRVFGLFGSKSK